MSFRCLTLQIRRKENYKQMRQAVTLTGLGTHKFKASLESILFIHAMFAKHVGKDRLAAWIPGYFQEHRTVEVWNRYFDHPSLSSSAIPFHPFVDPQGLLKSIIDGRLLHTEENEVRYYQAAKRADGKFK
jgi:hypothetical protein